jgi:hypothetical protein
LQPPAGDELAGPDQSKWRGLLTKARYRRGLAHCGTAATATKRAKLLLAGGEQGAGAGAAASAEEAAKAAQRAEETAELGVADLEEAAEAVLGGGGKAVGKAERSRQSAIRTSLREAYEGLAQARAEGRRARRAVGVAAKPAKKYSTDYGRFDAAAAELEGEVDSDDEREAVGKGQAAERRKAELQALAAKIEAMDDDALLENGGLDKAMAMVRRAARRCRGPCHRAVLRMPVHGIPARGKRMAQQNARVALCRSERLRLSTKARGGHCTCLRRTAAERCRWGSSPAPSWSS